MLMLAVFKKFLALLVYEENQTQLVTSPMHAWSVAMAKYLLVKRVQKYKVGAGCFPPFATRKEQYLRWRLGIRKACFLCNDHQETFSKASVWFLKGENLKACQIDQHRLQVSSLQNEISFSSLMVMIQLFTLPVQPNNHKRCTMTRITNNGCKKWEVWPV